MKWMEEPVVVTTPSVALEGGLSLPEHSTGLVMFVHGSGSSRHSSRNRAVARSLQGQGLGTLLFDLLTPEEEAIDVYTRQFRFDIGLLAERVIGALDWVLTEPRTRGLKIGCFGASTGAAAALIAAAERPRQVHAVVSRGGRPDLADGYLHQVTAPTLLIVGSADLPVVELNRQAAEHLRGEHEVRLVPGATHLFEEPGALEQVANQAGDWFRRHLLTEARTGQRPAA